MLNSIDRMKIMLIKNIVKKDCDVENSFKIFAKFNGKHF